MCLSCDTHGFFLFGASTLIKEAQSYIDEVVPKIIANWDVKELLRYSSDVLQNEVSIAQIEEQFRTLMKLGALKQYTGSQGHVLISSPSTDGQTTITGDYTAEAEFEAGHVIIAIKIAKERKRWSIRGFFVEPDLDADKVPMNDISSKEEELLNEQLETPVTRLPESNLVSIRKNRDKVYSLAEKYEQEGNNERAIHLYEKALQADPANLPYQLKLARLLLSNNRKIEGLSKVRYIHEFAEDDHLFQTAREILADMDAEPPEPTPQSVARKDIEVALIPMGNPNRRILSELKVALQERMGIAVSISDKSVELGKEDRKSADVYISQFFDAVQRQLSQLQRNALMWELGLDAEKLSSPVQQSRFIIAFFEKTGQAGQTGRQQFEAYLKKLGSTGEYDMTKLARELRSNFPIDNSDAIKCYLGVTPADVYVRDCNNCFGSTDGIYGVISYHQFSAEHTGEQQNRPRLVARLLKQALSSANFAMSIPRCNNPYCARSFPNSVSEHDAKTDALCRECKERLEAFKNDPRSLILADEYLGRYKWDKAIENYEKALEDKTGCGQAYEGLGRAYEQKGQEDLAKINYEKTLEIFPHSLRAHMFFGDYHVSRSELQDAFRHYSEVLQAWPDYPSAYYGLGRTCVLMGEWEKAIEHLETARRSFPDFADLHFLLGRAYENRQKTAEAVESYEKAIALNPSMRQVHYSLGRLLEKTGEKYGAIKQFEREIETDPYHFNAQLMLGRLYGANGSVEESITAFKAALAVKPQDPLVWNDLGYSYYLKKDYGQALELYEKALSMSSETAVIHYNKALAHYANSQFQQAIVHYDKAAALGYPGSPQFQKALAQHRK
jgi:tetratricopeptide (TPR) repeat protein